MTTEVEQSGTEAAKVEDTQTQTQTQAPAKPNTESRKGKSADELQDELYETIGKMSKAREEKAKLKTQVDELLPKVQRLAELEDQHTQAVQSHRVELAMARLETLAVKDGIVDPDALKLIDASELTFDDTGKPTNLADVLTSFKSAKPHFFTQAASARTSSVATPPKPSSTTASNAKDMGDDQWKAEMKKLGIQ